MNKLTLPIDNRICKEAYTGLDKIAKQFKYSNVLELIEAIGNGKLTVILSEENEYRISDSIKDKSEYWVNKAKEAYDREIDIAIVQLNRLKECRNGY
jgi:vacuolar-type H+-ATPase subunit E/Vma4